AASSSGLRRDSDVGELLKRAVARLKSRMPFRPPGKERWRLQALTSGETSEGRPKRVVEQPCEAAGPRRSPDRLTSRPAGDLGRTAVRRSLAHKARRRQSESARPRES